MTQYLITLVDDGSIIVWTPALVIPPADRKKFSQDIGTAIQQANARPTIFRPHVAGEDDA